MRSIWMGIAAGFVVATVAQAQQAELDVGARVRVHVPSLARRGMEAVVAGSGDTLVLVVNGARLRIPAAEVQRLELSRGRSRADGARTGALWGAAIGAAVGAASTSQARYTADRCHLALRCEDPTIGERLEYVGMATVGGAMWGALVGAIAGRERWDPIPVPRVAVTPLRGGGVGLQVRVGPVARREPTHFLNAARM